MATFQIFDFETGTAEGIAPTHRVVCVRLMLREAGPDRVGIDRSHDRPRVYAPRSLAKAMPPLAPHAASRRHHGIVIDWTAAVSSELFEVALVSWSLQ
jgi:hypothetical protein